MPFSPQEIDQTLTSIRKGLRKARIELQQLKKSLHQTLSDLKSFDLLLQQNQLKLTRQFVFDPYSMARKEKYSVDINFYCKKCSEKFGLAKELVEHEKKYHKKCSLCKEVYFESEEDHRKSLCGAWAKKCIYCNELVERKDLSEHVKVCWFKVCERCHQNIYAGTLSYHMKVCGREIEEVEESAQESVESSEGKECLCSECSRMRKRKRREREQRQRQGEQDEQEEQEEVDEEFSEFSRSRDQVLQVENENDNSSVERYIIMAES